jgi:hypothetical protein
VHEAAPAAWLYSPGWHGTEVPLVEPAGHRYPALQLPVHDAEVRPGAPPYKPAGHSPLQLAVERPVELPYVPKGQLVHAPAPPTEYVPRGQSTAVELVDPAGQLKPAEQLPLQATEPRAGVAPNSPGGQLLQEAAPARL